MKRLLLRFLKYYSFRSISHVNKFCTETKGSENKIHESDKNRTNLIFIDFILYTPSVLFLSVINQIHIISKLNTKNTRAIYLRIQRYQKHRENDIFVFKYLNL